MQELIDQIREHGFIEYPVIYDGDLTKRLKEKPGTYLLLIGDRFYVGSTGDLHQRVSKHRNLLPKGTHNLVHVQAAFNVHQCLRLFIRTCWSREEAYTVEQRIVDMHRMNPGILNRALVDVRKGTGVFRSAEQREVARQRSLGHRHTDIHRLRISQANTGKLVSASHRANLARALVGKPKTPEHVANIRAAKDLEGTDVIIDGVTYPSFYAAQRATGVCAVTIRNRARNPNPKFSNYSILNGEPLGEYIPNKPKGNPTKLIINGVRYTSSQVASMALGISRQLVLYRVESSKQHFNGWQFDYETAPEI